MFTSNNNCVIINFQLLENKMYERPLNVNLVQAAINGSTDHVDLQELERLRAIYLALAPAKCSHGLWTLSNQAYRQRCGNKKFATRDEACLVHFCFKNNLATDIMVSKLIDDACLTRANAFKIAEEKKAIDAAIARCTVVEEVPAVVTQMFVNQADNPRQMAEHLKLAIDDMLDAIGV